MPRLISVEGNKYSFPDEATDDDISLALTEHLKPPTNLQALAATPGMIARSAAQGVAGIDQVFGDVFGSSAAKDRAQFARRGIAAEAQDEQPRNMTLPQEMLATGITSVASSVPAIAASTLGALALGPATPLALAGSVLSIGTSVLGAQTGLQRYSELRNDDKFSPGRAGLHAVFEGLVEKWTEYLPAADILPGGKFFNQFSKYLTKEVGGELVATTLQDLSAKLSDNPKMTLGDFARDLAVTAGAVPLGGAMQFGAFKAAHALLPKTDETERTVPETPQTLQEQQLALKEGRRPAQMFPTGTPELELPADMERVETPRGVFHFNPGLIEAKTIVEASAAGRENEVLGLGPINKDDVAASGQPPVAVVERTQDGTEVLTAATTLQRLQETLDQLKEQAAKGNTVTVETPEQVVAERVQKGMEVPSLVKPAPLATSPEAVASAGTPVQLSVFTKQELEESRIPATPIKQESAVELQPVELRVGRGQKGAITVTFPERNLKELFRLGNMLMQQASSTNPPKASAIESVTQSLAEKFNLPESRVQERAQIYYETTRNQINAAEVHTSVAAMTLGQAQASYAENTYRQPHDLQAGKVALADGLMPTENFKNALAYLQRWQTLFLPRSRIVIVGETLAGASASVTVSKGVHYVAVPVGVMPKQSLQVWKAKWLFYLAHEFGHIIFNENVTSLENTPILAKLRAEHKELVGRISSMTVNEFVTAWYGPAWRARLIDEKGQIYGFLGTDPAMHLVAELDRLQLKKGQKGVTLSFEEWVAEQFPRYVNKERTLLDDTPETKVFWKSVYDKLQDFFDRVVKLIAPTETYKEFVDSLRSAPGLEEGYTSPPDTLKQEAVVESARISEEFEYTFKVLSRLPDKPRVKKATIMAETARRDVRGQESRLILDTLNDLPGDAVDMQIFKKMLLDKIAPLRTKVTDEYAINGIAGLGFTFDVGMFAEDSIKNMVVFPTTRGRNSARKQVLPFTRIYNVPFETGGSGHFIRFPNYYAHVRGFNLNDNGEKIRVIMEVQSDAEQRSDSLGENERAKVEEGLKEWKSKLKVVTTATNVPPDMREASIALYQRRIAELENKLREFVNLTSLPKNWEQHLLLSEMQKASKEGAKVLWIPGSDETVAKIEGYEKGLMVDGEFNFADEDNRVEGEVEPAGLVYPPEVLPIFKRYQELASWAKKSLGGKEVVYGADTVYATAETVINESSWVEIPLKPELVDLPITYYTLGEALDEQIEEALPELTKVEATLPKAVKAMGAAFINILSLNQMAKLWPGLHGLQTYRRAMQNLHAVKAKLLEGPNEHLRALYKLPTKQGELVEDALRAEVNSGGHWTELIKDQATGQWVHVLGESAKRVLTSMGLSKQAQEVFVDIKNDFMLTLQTMETVLREHVDNFFKNSPTVLAQRHAELDEMFKTLRETPFLPDSRFGQWSVQIRAKIGVVFEGMSIKKSDLLFWQKFDTKSERDKGLQEIRRRYGKEYIVSGSYDPDIIQPMAGMPGGFVTLFVEEMNQHESTRLTPEQVEAMQELAFYQTRAGKFARYLKMPKKGIGGASTDIRRVYAAYHWKAANAIAKMKYNRDLRNSIRQVTSAITTIRRNGGNSDQIDRMRQYLNDNYRHVMHPENDYPRLRAFVALWYLFGSVKTAVMNMSSLPILTYPYIAARHGDVTAVTSLAKAMRTVAAYWRDPSKVSPDIQKVLQKAREDGVTDQSLASIIASVSDGGVAIERILPKFAFMGNRQVTDSARKTTWRIMAMGMAPFQVIEQLNRQVTMVAMYELESQKLGKTLSQGDTTAYDLARDATDYTQNEFASWNQPKFMWGGKAVFFLFFSFVQNMSFLMFGGDKAWWRAMLILAVMGGFLALPGIENLIDILNYGWRKWSGQHQDLRLEAREVFEAIGMNPDLAMHGMSHNMLGLGWDVSSSIGAGRIIPGTDAVFGVGKFEQRFVQATGEVGGPAGGMLMAFLQALADSNPNTLLSMQKTLPAMFKSLAKGYSMLETGQVQDQHGRAVVQDATMLETLGQAAGFRPTRAAVSQELRRAQHDAAEYYSQRRSNLMEMYYTARKAGNSEAVADVQAAIEKYNAGVPVPQLKIMPKDLNASVKNRTKQEAAFAAETSPQKKYAALYQMLRTTYNDPVSANF